MNWNNHYELEGQHAFLSPSNYHWLNYDYDKLVLAHEKYNAKEEGVWLHNFASMAIGRRIKLARNRNTLNMFVNDAIGFGMKSEQILYYSRHAFGCTDAISFKRKVLRIHDYKSGETKASFKQLDVYSALFCLEYGVDPEDIEIFERLYQSNQVEEFSPSGEYIRSIMNNIIEKNAIVESLEGQTL